MKTVQNYIKPILALIITVTWIAFCFVISFSEPTTMSREVFTAFTPVVMLALGYYFGTTTGMTKKDETISNLTSKSE